MESQVLTREDFRSREVHTAALAALQAHAYLPGDPAEAQRHARRALQVPHGGGAMGSGNAGRVALREHRHCTPLHFGGALLASPLHPWHWTYSIVGKPIQYSSVPAPPPGPRVQWNPTSKLQKRWL
jgi:hypothetical protein